MSWVITFGIRAVLQGVFNSIVLRLRTDKCIKTSSPFPAFVRVTHLKKKLIFSRKYCKHSLHFCLYPRYFFSCFQFNVEILSNSRLRKISQNPQLFCFICRSKISLFRQFTLLVNLSLLPLKAISSLEGLSHRPDPNRRLCAIKIHSCFTLACIIEAVAFELLVQSNLGQFSSR